MDVQYKVMGTAALNATKTRWKPKILVFVNNQLSKHFLFDAELPTKKEATEVANRLAQDYTDQLNMQFLTKLLEQLRGKSTRTN